MHSEVRFRHTLLLIVVVVDPPAPNPAHDKEENGKCPNWIALSPGAIYACQERLVC